MAEHSLTIKATLDTSSVQSELDNINKNIATMDGATGGSSGGKGGRGGANVQGLITPIRQLQHSIDQLNSTIGKMALHSRVSGTQTLANNVLGNPNYTDSGSGLKGTGNTKTPWGNWVRSNRFARVDTMPLLMMATMGHQMSSVFSAMGNELASNITNLAESMASGAAMGGLRFGKIGAVIGTTIAAFSSMTNAAKDFNQRLNALIDSALDVQMNLKQTRQEYWKDRVYESAQDRFNEITRGEGSYSEKRKKLESELGTASKAEENAYNLQRTALAAMNELEQKLDTLTKVKVGAWVQTSMKEGSDFDKWITGVFGGYGVGGELSLSNIEREMADLQMKLKEQQTILSKARGEETQWKSLRESIQHTIDRYAKTEEKLRAQYEEQMANLKMERDNVIRGIEDTYQQQGVDILDNMGKAGKFMTQTAQNSVSQERYAPITKKLDNMQKSLDHLSKIDSKMSKINANMGLL